MSNENKKSIGSGSPLCKGRKEHDFQKPPVKPVDIYTDFVIRSDQCTKCGVYKIDVQTRTIERPIIINRDYEGEIIAPFDALQINGKNIPLKVTAQTSEEVKFTLSEALRVIEQTVKHLNQTKEAGRQEVRTTKDKENQKTISKLENECEDLPRVIKYYKDKMDAHTNDSFEYKRIEKKRTQKIIEYQKLQQILRD